MIDMILRVGIIFFSSLSIPLLLKLISGVYLQNSKSDRQHKVTAELLIFVFFVLLTTAVASIIISILAMLTALGLFDHHADLTALSRFRSLFFSIANFVASWGFYKIFRDGR